MDIQNQNQNLVQTSEIKSSFFGRHWFITFIVLVILLVAGFLFFLKLSSDASLKPTAFEIENRAKLADKSNFKNPSTITVDSTSWKTYKSERYDFEIKYPEDWGVVIRQSNVDGIFITKDNSVIAILPSGGFDYAQETDTTKVQESLSEKTVVTSFTDRGDSVEYQFTDEGIPKTWTICYEVFDSCNRIDISTDNSADMTLLSQILSTFKFTD